MTAYPLHLFHNREGCEILLGDALSTLRELPSEICRCCITSPPYWGLRDYGVELRHQIGAESDVTDYLRNVTEIFQEVFRILTPDGTLWLNLGDSYTSGNRTWRDPDKKTRPGPCFTAPPRPQV